MSARLLAELEALGVRLRADNGRLRVNAAAGALTDDLRARIGEAKPELLTLLAARRTAPEGEYPVSFAQRRLWFLDQLEPGNSAYNLGAVHTIHAAIDAAAMEAAINDIRQRQPALRTVFHVADGEPLQVVLPHAQQPLAVVDLSALDETQRKDECRRLTREEAAKPFDLAAGPLFRATLLRLGAERHDLLFTLHHIVCDGWSLGIFLADLHVAYEARAAGRTPAFEPLALYFGEHAARERATLSGATLDSLIDYWRGRLVSASPVLELPTDRPRPRQRGFGGAALDFMLPSDVSDALRALARQERATLYMTLLAVFKVLLFRCSGQSDIVIGTPVANRHASEAENVIGMFVGTLPIRSDLSPELCFRELLAQIRDNVLDAQAHAALPFEKIVDELQPERNLAWSPVYQVIFTLQNAPLASEFSVTTVATMVDLSLFMWDEPGPLRGTLEYNTALFDASTAERWRDHFVTLAGHAVASPDAAIGRLPMLTAAQRTQLLDGRNATARPYPRGEGLPAIFDAVVRRSPQAVAVESSAPEAEAVPIAQLSYAALARASGALERRLREHDVQPGDRVGLYLERSVAAVVGLLAIVKAGAAYVPVDSADPPVRTGEILHDAGVRLVLTQRSLAGRLGDAGLRTLLIEDAWTGVDADDDASSASVPPSALAYVMFTSGTTGSPKGVCVTHRNVARLVCNTDVAQLGPDETLLQLAPLAFDASTFEIWGALLNGGRLVVHPRNVPTAAELAQVLRSHRISTLWLTAGFFHHLVENELPALAGVRQVLAGGDVLSVSHVQRLLDAKTSGAVINGYGPTENTTFTCCHPMAPGDRLADTVPIGRPIANTCVYILDTMGEPVPTGVRGELYTGGDGVARGYLGNPPGTEGRFLPDPFDATPGATMYRTGDMARWRADGTIEFFGRRDRQVKVRGFRVELEEVEDALRSLPAVRDAAVIARRDASGANALFGYVVPRAPEPLEFAAIKQALAERLPPYMIPSGFVSLPALPLTPNGKLDRAALQEPGDAIAGTGEGAPRSQLEAQLHAIWERVLGRNGIGVHDNFFDVGGHSLLALRLFGQIERVLGVRLPVSALFLAPDIAQLARRLQNEGFASPWTSLVAIQPEGRRRPLFMVPGIGGNVLCYGELARLLGTDQPFYGLQARGLDERERPFERIEPMATHYVAEIRRVQPRGPYRIGGTCFGGLVAYEMARQLRQAGETTEMLFLLEAWPPPKPRPVVDALRTRSHQLRFFASAVRRNIAALRQQTLGHVVRALLAALGTVGEIARKGIYRGDTATMVVDRVTIANERSLLHYRLQPHAVPLRSAIAAGRVFAGTDTRTQWRLLAPDDFGQVDLPATDSGTMLLPPFVEPLAQWMSREIDALEARNPSSPVQA